MSDTPKTKHTVSVKTVGDTVEVSLDGQILDVKVAKFEVYPTGESLVTLVLAAVVEADVLTPVELDDIFPHG